MTTRFLVGFGEADITPGKPARLAGYYHERISTGVHDPLKVRAMAVSDGGGPVVFCVADLVYLWPAVAEAVIKEVGAACGLAPERFLPACVHTHTGPDLRYEPEYVASLPAKYVEAVQCALDGMTPRDISVGVGEESTLAFIRRYIMTDGSVRTNPGILNPDVDKSIGQPDYTLGVLLANDNGNSGGFVHYGLHCDTVGGTEISADWSHFLRARMQEQLGEGLRLLTPIGTAGDVNHWNVFEDVNYRGFAEAERIGSALAKAALGVLDDMTPVAFGPVAGFRKAVSADLRYPSDEELAHAREVWAREPDPEADFVLDRVAAYRSVKIADLGPTTDLDVSVLRFGNVALVGMPCELFTVLGQDIKARSPFDYTFVVTLSNAHIGYVGPRKAFKEGGYEITSTLLQPGMGERLADEAVALLERAAAL